MAIEKEPRFTGVACVTPAIVRRQARRLGELRPYNGQVTNGTINVNCVDSKHKTKHN